MIWSKRACSSPIQTAQLRSLPRCGHARISGCRQSARVNLNGLPFSIGPAGALPVAQRTTAASEVIAESAGGTICVAPRPPPTPFPILLPGSPNVPTPKGAADDGGPLHETRSFGCDLKRRSDGHREDAARRCGGRERNCYGRRPQGCSYSFRSPALIAGGASAGYASANTGTKAGAICAPNHRPARDEAPGFPKNSAVELPMDRPKLAANPIASTAGAASPAHIRSGSESFARSPQRRARGPDRAAEPATSPRRGSLTRQSRGLPQGRHRQRQTYACMSPRTLAPARL